MKVKLLVLAVVVLAMASVTFGQGGALCFYNETWLMTKNCGSGGAIPMGTKIWIMNDQDGDGWGSCLAPDDDPLPTLCTDPPDCELGPQGTLNRQYIPMGEGTGVAGIFFSDPCLMSSGDLPPYPRFYLKVQYCETTQVGPVHTIHCVTYLSRVVTMTMGIADADLAGSSHWTCCEWDTTWSDYVCVPDLYTQFSPIPPPGGDQPLDFHDCAKVCAGRPHLVSVGPVAALNRLPHGYVLPGCDPQLTPCDSDCVPAMGWTFGALVWTPRTDETGALWYDALILPLEGATDGCICIVVDFIEPAEIVNPDVVARSNAVEISWKTLSETSPLDHFAIYRDGRSLTTLTAHIGASGTEYKYVDTDVENGRTYAYDLRLVDINETETSFHTASVTPSFENALVTEYALHQNYPNPFNPSTKIAFDLVDNNPVTLTVYNATGQMVATLLDGVSYTKGRQSITFDSGNLTSGLYFYTVKIGNEFTATKKMLLVK